MPGFRKYERLCSKKLLDKLFAEGKSSLFYPIKITYLAVDLENPTPAQVVFIVPKKRFRRANKRNLIRRRMREAYRLQKDVFYKHLNDKNIKIIISISYVANDILPYRIINEQISKALLKI